MTGSLETASSCILTQAIRLGWVIDPTRHYMLWLSAGALLHNTFPSGLLARQASKHCLARDWCGSYRLL